MVPADIVRHTFRYTKLGVLLLLPSSHLQKRLKPPNPVLNLYKINETDVTDQIFPDTLLMNSRETNTHIWRT